MKDNSRKEIIFNDENLLKSCFIKVRMSAKNFVNFFIVEKFYTNKYIINNNNNGANKVSAFIDKKMEIIKKKKSLQKLKGVLDTVYNQ